MTCEIRRIEKEGARAIVKGMKLTRTEQAAFDNCLRQSTVIWAGWFDGRLACLWGVIAPNLLSQTAYLWLHAGEGIAGNEFMFIRQSQRVIEELKKQYKSIVGHCLIGEEKSQRWLRMLGAKFSKSDDRLKAFTISGVVNG